MFSDTGLMVHSLGTQSGVFGIYNIDVPGLPPLFEVLDDQSSSFPDSQAMRCTYIFVCYMCISTHNKPQKGGCRLEIRKPKRPVLYTLALLVCA